MACAVLLLARRPLLGNSCLCGVRGCVVARVISGVQCEGAMLLGADFKNALKSRKKYVEANDEGGEGQGTGTNKANQIAAAAGIMGFTDKSPTGFCGLANQGATCYLNSLLQSLFLLTEFRAALYAWEYRPAEHGDEDRNVARQLQRLFAYLQKSDRCCVTTDALTRSFGWTTGEQFQQQDVQECSAVIMDYLSRLAVGSPLGAHLHEHTGSTNRILRCQCGAERCREEAFRDLQLDVRDSSTGSPIGSVDRALAAYCATEIIEGVSCETCGEQRDHDKLLRFSQLPLYLPLVLKRFEMNWNTGQRMKISDWMSVPPRLDLASLVQLAGGEQTGETVYHLKSVLMHTGGAYGGHYFCYQQTAGEGSPWCKFNDASVTELAEDEIAAAFSQVEPEPSPDQVPAPPTPPDGEESTAGDEAVATAAGAIQAAWKRKHGRASGKKPAQPAVGKCAYMLIYVRADGVRRAPENPAPPADLAEAVEADNAKYRQLKDEWKEEQRWLRFKLRHPSGIAGDELEIRILREHTAGDLLDSVRERLACTNAREDCRLRVVHRQSQSLLDPLTGADGDATVLDSLVKPKSAPPSIALETKDPGGSFPEFKPGSTPIYLQRLADNGDTTNVTSVAVPKPATIGGLRKLVANHLQCHSSAARLIVLTRTEDQVTGFRELPSADDFLTLSSQDLAIGSQVVVEDAEAVDLSGRSALCHFDKLVNRLEIAYRVLPNGTSGVVEIDGREALLALKQRVAAECVEVAAWTSGEDIDPCAVFKIRLGDRFGGTGKEIKDLDQHVGAAGFSSLNNLVIEQGRPLNGNEFSITLRLEPSPSEGIPPSAAGGSSQDSSPAGPPPPPPPAGGPSAPTSGGSAKDLFGRGISAVVSQHEEVGELKQRAVSLASDAGVVIQKDCLRLRLSQNGGKLGAVLVDGVPIADALPKGKRLHDGLCIAIQPTVEPETFTRSHLLVRVQEWLPDKTQLGPPPRELAVESGVTSTADLQRTLAAWIDATGEGSDPCPPEAIKFLKPFGFQIRDPQSLPLLWHTKTQPAAESHVTEGALNLRAGDLLLYKDSRTPEQIEPPAVDESKESDSSASGARPEAPGFRILTPSEQIEAERQAAMTRTPDAQNAKGAQTVDAAKEASLGSSAMQRTKSV